MLSLVEVVHAWDILARKKVYIRGFYKKLTEASYVYFLAICLYAWIKLKNNNTNLRGAVKVLNNVVVFRIFSVCKSDTYLMS